MQMSRWLKPRGTADPLERIVETFEADAGSEPHRLVRYWEKVGPGSSPSVLAALVKADLHRRFEAGERPRIDDYLREFPVLADDHDRVVSLVYEEFCLLEEQDERPDSEAFCDLYDRWRDSLRSQLDYHRELSRAVNAEFPSVDFPKPGDQFDRYHLISLLGVGGAARVYIATEEELAGRPMVIKISPSFGQEATILAQLDHRNIVPIWTVARSETGLRGLCMPYRPGVTIEELIRRIGRGKPPRSAQAIGDALNAGVEAPESPPDQLPEGWSDFPIRKTFAEGVAWLGLALANALAYMHGRGVYHRDIKPANILLAYREGPQLLDFNLAKLPSNAQGASAAQKGGTLPYSAPEQLRAFLDPSVWEDVGPAADLYSLGLVLRELLTGRPPELPTSRGSGTREIQSLLDRRLIEPIPIVDINPSVPPALDSIVRKCTAFHFEGRYASADELAADLQRFLNREPLAVAPNTSKFEVGVNWIYRNRKSILWGTLAILVLASVFRYLPTGGDARLADAAPSLDSDGPEKLELDRRCAEAERLFDSEDRAGMEQARTQFESLHGRFPMAARPAVGLALTLKRLDDSNSPRCAALLEEASNASDAEQVIQGRLQRYPRWDLLHRTLGLARFKHGKRDLARKSFERSIELNPDKHSSFVYLAQLDDLDHDLPSAANHLSRALEVCKEDKDGAAAHDIRRSLLGFLVHLIDKELEDPKARDAKDRWRFEAQLKLYRNEREGLSDAGQVAAHPYYLAFFEACLASITGALEPNPVRARSLFDEAAHLFEEAEKSTPKALRQSGKNPAIETQLKTLAERRAAKLRDAAQ